MADILHLSLHRVFFANIVAGKKRTEYRKRTPYWRKRLKDKKYKAILFSQRLWKKRTRNAGGISRSKTHRTRAEAIRLGRILKLKRWPPKEIAQVVSHGAAGGVLIGGGMVIQQGDFVEARGRPWLVEAVDDSYRAPLVHR